MGQCGLGEEPYRQTMYPISKFPKAGIHKVPHES
jgi:hypothetical protein